MFFPESIEKYILQNAIVKDDLFYLITSVDGKIEDVGNSTNALITQPLVGENVFDYLPVFTGLFPVVKNIYLPNVQLTHDRIFNVHLIVSDQKVWILNQNVTYKIEQYRQQHERSVELKKVEFSLLEALDYFVLKKTAHQQYVPVSVWPKWMAELNLNHQEPLQLEIHFPFLAFFVDQVDRNQFSENDHYSGIWTQNTADGGELHLNAWSFRIPDETYLIIHPVNVGPSAQFNVIQLARENSLAYEQLKKTKEQLQELVQLKDQFVSIVSHDFRSPISTLTDGISFLLEDLSKTKTFDDSHRDIIVQIKNELIRLLNYNDKLYNWTKLNLGSIELNVTTVSIDLLVSTLNGQFDKRLNEKNIRLNLMVHQHVELETDYILLNQAISNLIDNAIKFSHENGEIVIEIDEHFLKISDRGIGMSPSKIDEITRGYSLKSTSGTKGEAGSGLGLSIVTRILKTLNFKFDIQSEINKGTTFMISF